MGTTGFLIVVGAVLLCTAFYSVARSQRASDYFTQEMRSLIDEANIIKKDLESLMDGSILLSDEMIQKLDSRLSRMEVMEFTESSAPHKGVRPQHISAVASEPVAVAKFSPNAPYVPQTTNANAIPFPVDDLRRAHPSIVVPRLHFEGFSVQEIAELLDRGQGEVQLILDLHRKRQVGG